MGSFRSLVVRSLGARASTLYLEHSAVGQFSPMI
jgi:hypothetical protein